MKDNATKDARENPMLGLFGIMETPDGNLVSENQGAAEARQMKELPTKGTKGQEKMWELLGFKLGDPNEEDPLFRPVLQAPKGWKLTSERGDARHMVLLDDKGRKRASMFYKNAFYDRKADISLNRRLSIDYHPDFDNNTKLVVDASRSVYEDKKTILSVLFSFDEPMKDGEERWDYADRARTACAEWLDKHYPDWESPLAYWDVDITGERFEHEQE